MFDSAFTKCPGCHEHEVEIQFKVYLGHYRPDMRDIRPGELIPGFPKVSFETDGIFHCPKGDKYGDDALLMFRGGRLETVQYPLPENYAWTPLPKGQNTDRRERAKKESDRREHLAWEKKMALKGKRKGGFQALGEIMGDFMLESMGRIGFARRLLLTGPYRNYQKISDKWTRITAY